MNLPVDPLRVALADLLGEVEAFEGCPLKATAQRVVFGDGDPTARVMIIGEAPGANEDRVGKPFVGRSGQFLDRLLGAMGVARAPGPGEAAAYITNAVFWRPPANRPPTPAETLACRPFLLRHIALIRPAVLLLVGSTAAQSVLQVKAPMADLRQRWLDFPLPTALGGGVIPALATFHPAYMMRNPAAIGPAWADLGLLHARLVELGVLQGAFPAMPARHRRG